MCLILVAVGLHCCAWAFSSCSVRASHCGGFSLQSTGSRLLGSVVAALRLQSAGLVALKHVESSWIREQTCDPCP